jgi:hypothetical protein
MDGYGYSHLYPQGLPDFCPEDIVNEAWARPYAEHRDDMFSIGVAKDFVEPLSRIINGHKGWFLACENHASIVNAIFELELSDSSRPTIDLKHIDFHHDMCLWGTGGGVNCSNWVNKCLRVYKERFTHFWFHRLESDFKTLGGEVDCRKIPLHIVDFDAMGEQPFDMIFVCRSGVYSPPHLDYDFIRYMIPTVQAVSGMSSIYIEDRVLCPRPLRLENSVKYPDK